MEIHRPSDIRAYRGWWPPLLPSESYTWPSSGKSVVTPLKPCLPPGDHCTHPLRTEGYPPSWISTLCMYALRKKFIYNLYNFFERVALNLEGKFAVSIQFFFSKQTIIVSRAKKETILQVNRLTKIGVYIVTKVPTHLTTVFGH